MWEFTRYGLREKTELLILSFLFYVNWRWKGPAALFGQSRCFTAACMGGKLAFSSFPPLRGEETGIRSFTAVLIGGNVDFPVFLRSERRKAGNSRYAKGTYGGYLSIRFFNLFSLLLLAGGSWVGA